MDNDSDAEMLVKVPDQSFCIGPAPTSPEMPLGVGWLWLHGGGTGDYKSSMLYHLAYETALMQGYPVATVAVEEPHRHVRSRLVARHSLHPKFEEQRQVIGFGLAEAARARGRRLLPRHEDFYHEVGADFDKGPVAIESVGENSRLSCLEDLPLMLQTLRGATGCRREMIFLDDFMALAEVDGFSIGKAVRHLLTVALEHAVGIFATWTPSITRQRQAMERGHYVVTDFPAQEIMQMAHAVTTTVTTPELRDAGLVRVQHHKAPYGLSSWPSFEMRAVPGLDLFEAINLVSGEPGSA